MDKKVFLGIALLLVLFIAGTASAIPFDINSVEPTLNDSFIGTKINSIIFTIKDSNAAPDMNLPQKLLIYWSTVSGSYQNLIINDTNVLNGVDVNCNWGTPIVKDRNFNAIKTCSYSWTVPDYTTMPPNQVYYIDYNLQIAGLVADNPARYTGFTSSSPAFQVYQPMSASIVAMIVLALFIAAAALAVYAVFGLTNGSDIRNTLQMFIVAMVLIVIAWSLYAVVVVA